MLKERIKSSAIVVLLFNMLFLSGYIWFAENYSTVGNRIMQYIRTDSVFSVFFPVERSFSIPKENLSKPRKFLINDGSLWMAYYNTDIGYTPIEQRTRTVTEGFLKGEIKASRKIDYKTWQEGLESQSIYIEYPISFSVPLLCEIMGIAPDNVLRDVSSVRDFIILPSSGDGNIYLLVKDAVDQENVYAYIMDDKYTLPAEDLAIYNDSSDGYYEPAFSTGIDEFPGEVSLAPLVLFSDSRPQTEVLSGKSLTGGNNRKKIIGVFSFNPTSVNGYTDKNESTIYIENYSSARFYSDSLFEYSATSDERGIFLNDKTDAYSVLNSSIDFAENVWKCVSDRPFNVLVTSDLSDYDSSNPYTFRFDYYLNGRPVEIRLEGKNGHKEMNCAIEMTVCDGRLISYRQYLRSYDVTERDAVSVTFVDALDYFVGRLSSSILPVVIEDIYIGYLDSGEENELHAGWLAKANGSIYKYQNSAVRNR